MAEIDDALASPENYAAYIRSLPDANTDSMYRIVIRAPDEEHVHDLLWADSDGEAMDEFELRYLEWYRDNGIDSDNISFLLYSPVELGEERTLVAEYTNG